MPIKLLALDLDGTIVADFQTVSPRVKTAIHAAVQRGVKVSIATGREYHATEQFLELLQLDTPVICFQGALIFNPHSQTIIARYGIPLAQAHQLIELARAHRLALNLYLDDSAYAEIITPQSQAVYQTIGAALTQVDDLNQITTNEPIKGLIIHDDQLIDPILDLLRDALGSEVRVVRSLNTHIEIIAATVSKGHALATLADYYSIDQSEVMAIGDQDNDVELIEWAGLGVAMGNASPAAKIVADHIAPSLNDDGAAWAIEKFILEK